METQEKTLVDVIIPNYNKRKFLKESISSVINQSYKRWHLYIIDDFSTDGSSELIDQYSYLKNVTIIKLKKNKGPSFCRNYGMRISRSKYISFLDSDDGWSLDKLEKQINFMEKNNFNFTYTDYTPFFEKNGKKKYANKTNLVEYFDYKNFIKNSSINTCTMIVSRAIVGHSKFKKIKLHEDYLFKCDLLKKNNIARKLHEDTAFYRILATSRSSKRMERIYWLWYINKNFNKLNFINNLISIFFIIINSVKKYGRIK
tara:strand:- start:324 stop:1097 length:774 start_codon:yes stop_codon:yes gene_type:complete